MDFAWLLTPIDQRALAAFTRKHTLEAKPAFDLIWFRKKKGNFFCYLCFSSQWRRRRWWCAHWGWGTPWRWRWPSAWAPSHPSPCSSLSLRLSLQPRAGPSLDTDTATAPPRASLCCCGLNTTCRCGGYRGQNPSAFAPLDLVVMLCVK